MKLVIELHNKHKNQPIWIVGSDPTISDYPDDFLDNKIGITLHLAHMKFPDATYRYANELDRVLFLKKWDKDYLSKKNLFAWPFYNKSEEKSKEATKGADLAYYLLLKPYPSIKLMKSRVTEAINAKSNLYGGDGTCLHACMYVAIMMGCNPINIIGCGFQTIKGREHFDKANKIDQKMRPKQLPFSAPLRRNRMIRGFNAIIEECAKHNITVNRHLKYHAE